LKNINIEKDKREGLWDWTWLIGLKTKGEREHGDLSNVDWSPIMGVFLAWFKDIPQICPVDFFKQFFT
jgi:hypothetical protein